MPWWYTSNRPRQAGLCWVELLPPTFGERASSWLILLRIHPQTQPADELMPDDILWHQHFSKYTRATGAGIKRGLPSAASLGHGSAAASAGLRGAGQCATSGALHLEEPMTASPAHLVTPADRIFGPATAAWRSSPRRVPSSPPPAPTGFARCPGSAALVYRAPALSCIARGGEGGRHPGQCQLPR